MKLYSITNTDVFLYPDESKVIPELTQSSEYESLIESTKELLKENEIDLDEGSIDADLEDYFYELWQESLTGIVRSFMSSFEGSPVFIDKLQNELDPELIERDDEGIKIVYLEDGGSLSAIKESYTKIMEDFLEENKRDLLSSAFLEVGEPVISQVTIPADPRLGKLLLNTMDVDIGTSFDEKRL